MGETPEAISTVNRESECTCDFCEGWRAALALQSACSNCPSVATSDAGLQRVIAAWDGLPESIRRAILSLIAFDPRAAAG
jgi:hypothetical protein